MAETAYDRVAYPGKFFVQSNPDRLGVLGRLRGLPTVPADSARVLEVGCGDGNNLIPFAERFPRSRVVGVDSSAKAIAAARVRAGTLGLDNAQFHCADLRDFLFMRQFRCDALCRLDASPQASLARGGLDTLFVTSSIRPASTGNASEFEHPSQGRLAAEHKASSAFAQALSAMGGRASRFPEIVVSAGMRLGRPLSQPETDQCAAFLVAMFERGFADLRTVDLAMPQQSSERPRVSALNRLLAGHEEPVVTRELNTFYLPTALLKRLVPLLDGSRTKASLALALSSRIGAGSASEEALEEALDFLAMNAMLLPDDDPRPGAGGEIR